MNYDLPIVFSSLLFWFYIDCVKLFSNERVINSALIHAFISGIGNSIGLVMYPIIVYDYSQIADNVPPFIKNVALISFGYSFYDLYIGVRSKKMDNILHGFIFVSSFTVTYHYSVMEMTSITMITEASSIFLNLRPYKKRWIDISFVPTLTRPAPMTEEAIWELAVQCTIGGDLHADKFARAIEAHIKGSTE